MTTQAKASTLILGRPGHLDIVQPALAGRQHALFYSGVVARLPLSSGSQLVLVAGGDARLRDGATDKRRGGLGGGGRVELAAELDDAALAALRWEDEPYFALLMVDASDEIVREQFLWPALYDVALRGLQAAGEAAQDATEMAEEAL